MILPSKEQVWRNYFPEGIKNLQSVDCSLNDYLKSKFTNENSTAIRFYERDISYKELFEESDKTAKSLKFLGVDVGTQIPVFLEAVPTFLMLLLAAEKLGASLVCRDGTVEEELEVIKRAQSKIIFVHENFSEEKEKLFKKAGVQTIICVDRLAYAGILPDYVCLKNERKNKLESINWFTFLELGTNEKLEIKADFNAPLLRAYTTGTTGASKQVIHSAKTIVNTLIQISVMIPPSNERLTALHTILPPSLIAVTVSMMLFPLTTNMLLILDPYVDVNDLDLSFMKYRPNFWPNIPMFINSLINSTRFPEDYDMSYFLFSGTGAEFLNQRGYRYVQRFLKAHNCNIFFTSGYGMSEACSNVLLPVPDMDLSDFSYGIPMPLTNVGIFIPDTDKELGYNQLGEFCICSDSVMLGYDNKEETDKIIRIHSDGKKWLHTGDIGMITKKGHVHIYNRGFCKHYTGGNLFISLMENKIVDIKGIRDCFFVLVPDKNHEGFFLPYLYLVLKEKADFERIKSEINDLLDEHEIPVEISLLNERPFFHFKTARKILLGDILNRE